MHWWKSCSFPSEEKCWLGISVFHRDTLLWLLIIFTVSLWNTLSCSCTCAFSALHHLRGTGDPKIAPPSPASASLANDPAVPPPASKSRNGTDFMLLYVSCPFTSMKFESQWFRCCFCDGLHVHEILHGCKLFAI